MVSFLACEAEVLALGALDDVEGVWFNLTEGITVAMMFDDHCKSAKHHCMSVLYVRRETVRTGHDMVVQFFSIVVTDEAVFLTTKFSITDVNEGSWVPSVMREIEQEAEVGREVLVSNALEGDAVCERWNTDSGAHMERECLDVDSKFVELLDEFAMVDIREFSLREVVVILVLVFVGSA